MAEEELLWGVVSWRGHCASKL